MPLVLNNFVKFSILIFGLFILVPSEQRGVLVIILAFAAVLSFFVKKKIRFLKHVAINSTLLLIYAFSLLHTFSIDLVAKKFETALSIIIIPICFALIASNNASVFSKKITQKLGYVLMFSALVFSFYIFIIFAYLGYFNGNVSYQYCLTYLNIKLPLIKDHPIYLSIILAVSILFSFSKLLSQQALNNKKRLLIVLALILITFTLFFMSRKGVILALIISLIVIIYPWLKKKSKKTIIVFTTSLSLVITVLFFLPQVQKRFSELFNTSTYTKNDETNSTNNRIQIYNCAVDLIKEKPFLGYGIANDRNALYTCYKENLYYLFENKYNTHNQYLSLLMKSGLLGLTFFIFFIVYNIKIALKFNDNLYLSIILFYLIIFLFENVLERQNGIIFFAFLFNFFCFKNSSKFTKQNS
ncbi:MAG: O-antigen ligase family protein [Winogradskyella sp.]